MGISEMANAGNLQYIPETWQDVKRKNSFDVQGLMQSPPEMREWLNNKWADLAGIKDPAQRKAFAKNFDNLHPVLDFWNKGSMERLPADFSDVFKTYGTYEGELWPEVRKYLKNIGLSDATINMNPQRFDMTDIAKLMLPENAGELSKLTTLAESAAAKNREIIPQAQKELIDDMVHTVQRNVRRQKFKALPGLAGGVGTAGLGIFGVVDGIRRATEAAKPKFNIEKLFS